MALTPLDIRKHTFAQKLRGVDPLALAIGDDLGQVAQLPDVAGPGIGFEQFPGFVGEFGMAAGLSGEALQIMLENLRYIVGARA